MTFRRSIDFGIAAVLLLGIAGTLWSDVPLRNEQFIYSVLAFNGKDYGGTFVRPSSNTLYLLAGTDNFISARKTFVYFWPITGSYRLDTDTLNHQFDGTLRVRGKGIDERLAQKQYTYYDLRGTYEQKWQVAKGENAVDIYNAYRRTMNAYQKAYLNYQQALGDYKSRLEVLARQIYDLRNSGKDVTALVEKVKAMNPPEQPAVPVSRYTEPPAELQKAFIVNLKPGEYDISFQDPDGTIMQSSLKQLVVFSENSPTKTGYDVIPGDKWTRPEISSLQYSVLYVNGSTDIYLRPYYEAEYNALFYQKLLDNDAHASPRINQWVKLSQVPNATIMVRSGGSRTTPVTEENFQVQQSQGGSLGYRIVPWSQFKRNPQAKPDLIAYRLPIATGDREVQVFATDSSGNTLPGSVRQIRIITAPGPEIILVLFMLLPIAGIGFVLVLRGRKYRGGPQLNTGDRD